MEEPTSTKYDKEKPEPDEESVKNQNVEDQQENENSNSYKSKRKFNFSSIKAENNMKIVKRKMRKIQSQIKENFPWKMGNSLCKERVNRANNNNNPKNPVDRVIGRCAQICPNSLGKQKHFWDKQVLETSPPPLQSQPQTIDGWRTASLTVPDGGIRPIPPPRKKRKSMLRKDDTLTKNGFREVFTGHRSMSTESSLNDSKEIARFSDFESMPIISTSPSGFDDYMKNSSNLTVSSEDEKESKKRVPLTRKVSKVGNKKSDRFFGENLSDCLSDEPITIDNNEKVDKVITELSKFSSNTNSNNDNNIKRNAFEEKEQMVEEKSIFIDNVDDSDEMSEKIRKEKGDMLFTMYPSNSVDSIDYSDCIPVEEEVIVPVKRPARHICDDEDRLSECLHLHGEAKAELIAPKKPQRDFTKYKKSLEELNLDGRSSSCSDKTSHTDIPNEHKVEENESKKISLSLDNATPPPPPKDNSLEDIQSTISLPPFERLISEPDAKTVEILINESSESNSTRMPHSEKILRRCLSSQSYLTSDLIDKITQEASNLSLSRRYDPEDYISSCNDGSALVSPNSKLEQKRTPSPQVSSGDLSKPNTKSKDSTEIIEVIEQPISSNCIIAEVTKENLDLFLRNQNDEDESNTLNGSIESESLHSSKLMTDDGSNQDKLETKTRTISNSSRDSNNLSDAVTDSLKSIELNPLPDTDEMHISNSDEISKTIKEFIDKDGISPEHVLKFLEEEFGDLLYTQRLPENDKQFLDELRQTVDSMPEEPFASRTRNLEKIQEDILENHPIVDGINGVQANEGNIGNLANNITNNKNDNDKNETKRNETDKEMNGNHNCEVPTNLTNRLKNKFVETIITNDIQRRHSIDDLDSWFSPTANGKNGENKHDFPEKKRKREVSLPGCLELPNFEDTSNDSLTSTIIADNSPIQTPTTESCPSEFASIETVKNVFTNEIIPTEIAKIEPILNKKNEKMNGDHSLLLKFLDIERSKY